jgi:hypothetical protein
MVNAVRSFLPTDLPALVAYSGLSYENEAWPRERLGAGESQATLTVVRDQLLAFARKRGTWVSVRRQRLQGLVGARQRGGNEAWEIDYLIDATRDRRISVDLLEHAVTEAGKEGAQKLFLRLPGDSDLVEPARNAGFLPYQEETLYVRQGAGSDPATDLRPLLPSDSYPLFRLYCQATPEPTRRLEAVTFAEWHAAQERRWLKNGLQLILERDGQLHATVRAARLPQGLLLDLMLTADATPDALGIVNAACAAAELASDSVFVLVPEAAEGLARRLEEAGFTPRQAFVSMMRRTARPLALPQKVAAVAKNAVGV